MHNPHSKNNSNIIATTATLFILGFFIVAASVGSTGTGVVNVAPVYGQVRDNSFVTSENQNVGDNQLGISGSRAPSIVSGDNIYIAWWTNNTSENGNEEVMFTASTDGGATFSNKTNLSNTTDADSWRVEIAGEGDTVVVSWWETNQTSDIPVARISTDGGATFGPMLMLGMNGTISGIEEGEEATAGATEEGGEGEAEGDTAEGVIEEAVGGTEVAE